MSLFEQVETSGYALIERGLSSAAVAELATNIEAALAAVDDPAISLRNRAGVYGARNVLELCPAACTAWRTPPLEQALTAVLGDAFGLVRGLYFDKPPQRSWSLPWHQDLTIAVTDHRPSTQFRKPTTKAGVPHVEAPPELLAQMLTLRIHLDDVTDENGPLQVLPGTHRSIADEPPALAPVTIFAKAGDVLAMRPLLFHASGASTPGTARHRRILHLEFAAQRELPEGFAWQTWLR